MFLGELLAEVDQGPVEQLESVAKFSLGLEVVGELKVELRRVGMVFPEDPGTNLECLLQELVGLGVPALREVPAAEIV